MAKNFYFNRKFLIHKTMFFSLLLHCTNLQAQEIPEHYHPIRPNSMGGAFTAIANDEASVWTNPAGVSRIRKARSRSAVNLIKFPNAVIGRNTGAGEFYSTMKSGQNAVIDNADNIEDSKPFWAMAGAFPMMMFDLGDLPTVTGWFSHLTAKAVIDRENPTQANTQIVWDTGPLATLSWTNRTNRFSFGVQGRSIARGAYEEYVPLDTLVDKEAMNNSFKANSNASTAFAMDMGMILTLADFWYPTVGISVLNVPLGCKKDYLNPFSKTRETICGTVFKGNIKNEDAISTVDPTDIRFGFSITPRPFRKLGMRIAVDIHHFHYLSGSKNYGFSDIPILKKTHVGVELFTGNPLLPSPLTFSAGMSQGYATAGGSVRLGFLSVDLAIFGRDISTSSTAQEDRRAMLGLSFDF